MARSWTFQPWRELACTTLDVALNEVWVCGDRLSGTDVRRRPHHPVQKESSRRGDAEGSSVLVWQRRAKTMQGEEVGWWGGGGWGSR